MQPSLVTARCLLLLLISPLIQDWLDYLEANPKFLHEICFPRLREDVGAVEPALWTLHIDQSQTPAALEMMGKGPVLLGDVLRKPRQREQKLPCVPLVLHRDASKLMLPSHETALRSGDELLICSRQGVEPLIRTSLANVYTLQYLCSGQVAAQGFAMGWLASRRS